MKTKDLKYFLDQKVAEYNHPRFIATDPVSIPHLFSRKQDQEIAGFFAAVFAWGNRTIIINKSRELMQLMDMAPYQFIMQHEDSELQKLLAFKHRTFNTTDLLYFIAWLRQYYLQNDSLENAFLTASGSMRDGLAHFHQQFFSLEYAPGRTRKHIATPERKSNCKRLNMFLRWMVRKDSNGVDFGIWRQLQPHNLIIPIDVHVARVAKELGLLDSQQKIDWNAAETLTNTLKELDPADPVKYDFALFGIGIAHKNKP